MARLDSKFLFFTTSPRTPVKMFPEIRLLVDVFAGKKWNTATQTAFVDELAKADFFEGNGSPKDKAFSARDRINRAPKALGFVDLKPQINLTDAGHALLFGKRPHEVFLRQLLKFQLPSPFHVESAEISGTFYVRPYLEIMRLIRELEYLTFDELKIFAVQLTDFRKFDLIKDKIFKFRDFLKQHPGQYKRIVDGIWEQEITQAYQNDIQQGKTKTRETSDASLKKFIKTKKSNLRDYSDACFRYLRYTGLISIEHRSRRLSFFADKLKEVDYILTTVNRAPVFIDDEQSYKNHLYSATQPQLYVDIKENILDTVMRVGSFSKRELQDKTIDELKDLRDQIIQDRKDAVIKAQVAKIKSYSLYSEIIDTYNEILSDDLYDAPLMLEYNTWRAMTMLDGGNIKGNLKFDDIGQPLSTAQGNMPDIECDYDNFVLSVEVTMQQGQRQYETEGEPVARHYGQMKQRTGKDAYCLFIAPKINPATLAHFYALNQMNISYYGGKSKIVPLELEQFMKLVDTSYNHSSQPVPQDIRNFLESAVSKVEIVENENGWYEQIQQCVSQWLVS